MAQRCSVSSSQQDSLRVIVTALGTQQVLYFRRVPNGLVSNDGVLYLSLSALSEIQRQEELAKQAQQKAQEAEAQQRAERQRPAILAAQCQAEEQRLADERARKEASEKLRALLTTRPVLGGTYLTGYGPTKLTLRVMSFDSGTGSVSAEVEFDGDKGKPVGAVGHVSGETLDLTMTKPAMLFKLQFNGSTRKLVGQWGPGKKECAGCTLSFDLK